jgi:ribonuclease VapC
VFVDTSAIVAMVASEPDADTFSLKLQAAIGPKISGAHVLLEATMRLSSLLGLSPAQADELVTRLLREAQVDIVPITEDIAHRAVTAFERYGKGRGHPARLNFGDCLSYACAKAHGAAILFKGNDFTHTDALLP